MLRCISCKTFLMFCYSLWNGEQYIIHICTFRSRYELKCARFRISNTIIYIFKLVFKNWFTEPFVKYRCSKHNKMQYKKFKNRLPILTKKAKRNKIVFGFFKTESRWVFKKKVGSVFYITVRFLGFKSNRQHH